MAKFTRDYLLLMYNSSANKYAFAVRKDEYGGGINTQPKDVSRAPDGSLLVVRGTSKREFIGTVVCDEDATGTVEYDSVTYNIGTPANLIACLEATDLEAKSVEDTSFWNAESLLIDDQRPLYEHDGTTRDLRVHLVEK